MLTHDMTRGIYLNTWIGEGCVLGPRSIVMPGVKVGDRAVIAPGAVVVRDVPPEAYVVGNPAQVQSGEGR